MNTRDPNEIIADIRSLGNPLDAWVPAFDACDRRRLYAELAESLRERIAESRERERSLIEQAGAMGLADTGTRIAVQALVRERERMEAELRNC